MRFITFHEFGFSPIFLACPEPFGFKRFPIMGLANTSSKKRGVYMSNPELRLRPYQLGPVRISGMNSRSSFFAPSTSRSYR